MQPAGIRLITVVSQAFEENCYIAYLDGREDCLVIDPGLEPERILEELDRQHLTPAAILNTHGHADHIGGNAELKRRWPSCPLVIGVGDAPKLSDPQLNLSAPFGMGITSPPADKTVRGRRASEPCWNRARGVGDPGPLGGRGCLSGEGERNHPSPLWAT